MTGLKLSLLFVIYIVCALAEHPETDKYASGPLPNLRLKKTGVSLKNVAMRLESSPGPCNVCCAQQRDFERACRRFDTEEDSLETVTETLDAAMAAAAEIREEVLAKVREIGRLQSGILRRLRRIVEIDADIRDGGESREELDALRALRTRLRDEAMLVRSRIQARKTERNQLKISLEDAAATIKFSRQDVMDEEAAVQRAADRRDRARAVLDRCLARQ